MGAKTNMGDKTKACNKVHILHKTLCKKNFDLGKAVGRDVALVLNCIRCWELF